MGCKHSKTVDIDGGKKVSDPETEDENEGVRGQNGSVKRNSVIVDPEPPTISPEQKQLIVDTWKVLVENISSVGVITFMSLFETHPDVQEVFMPFKGLTQEEMRYSKELRAHALRVMGFVQKVVARLEEPIKVEQLLKELGRNHVMYGAKADYIDLIGPQFVFAVKPSLEDKWTSEIEEAWLQLFRHMAYIMKFAMSECVHGQKQTPDHRNGQQQQQQQQQ